MERLKRFARSLPEPALVALFMLYKWARRPAELAAVVRFVATRAEHGSPGSRAALVLRCYRISCAVDCPHTESEILACVATILRLDDSIPGCVVEAGSFKGGSTAKFSLAAKLAGRRLVVFDSFAGMPENDEPHDLTIFGELTGRFPLGCYSGTLDEVRSTVARHGAIDVCTFVPGWFEDTMPSFSEPVAAAYIDVDLASSTRTCLEHLYPRLQPGGTVYSQDGHLPLVVEVFDDDDFWRSTVGVEKPRIVGLGRSKLLSLARS